MSRALDWALGEEMGTIYSRTELMEMLKLQIDLGGGDRKLREASKRVTLNALQFTNKVVGQAMSDLQDVYMLPSDIRLGYENIRDIFEADHARIPIYGEDREDFRGLLFARDLMHADPAREMPILEFIEIFNRRVEVFTPSVLMI